MAEGDDLWSILESGVRAGRQRAEELLRGVARDGEVGRERADEIRERGEEIVEDLVARSKRGSEALREMVRAEVRRELDAFVARRVDDVRHGIGSFAKDRRRDLADLIRKAGAILGELGSTASRPERPGQPSLPPGAGSHAPELPPAGSSSAGAPGPGTSDRAGAPEKAGGAAKKAGGAAKKAGGAAAKAGTVGKKSDAAAKKAGSAAKKADAAAKKAASGSGKAGEAAAPAGAGSRGAPPHPPAD